MAGRKKPGTWRQSLLSTLSTAQARLAAFNLTALAIVTLLTQVFQVATVFLLSTALTKSQFGGLTFALSVFGYICLFGGFGVKPVLMRDAIQRRTELDQLATANLVVTGVASSLAGLLAIGASAVAGLPLQERCLIFFFAIGGFFASIHIRPLYDARRMPGQGAAFALVAELVSLALIVTLYYVNALNLLSAGAALAFRAVLTTTLQYALWHRVVRRMRFVLTGAAIWSMAASSFPLMLTSLLSRSPFFLSMLFVKSIHGNDSAGTLGMALQVSSAYLLLAGLISRILIPHIAGPSGMDRVQAVKVVSFSGAYLSTLGILCAFGSYVLFTWLLPAFRDSTCADSILIVGSAAFSTAGLGIAYLLAQRRERLILLLNLIWATTYLLAGCFVIPRFGAIGAAWLTAVVYLVAAATTAVLAALGLDSYRSASHVDLAIEGGKALGSSDDG